VSVVNAPGGGFTLGSCSLYRDFLLGWYTLLLSERYKHPGIFALEYGLSPGEAWPNQEHDTLAGYAHVLGLVTNANRICVSNPPFELSNETLAEDQR
jgi:acetyl esterase/lipase